MSRLPGSPAGAPRNPAPDVYTALLLAAILFMLVALVTVFLNLSQNYDVSIGQLFNGASIPN